MAEAPEMLFNEDGGPVAVRLDVADNAATALRFVVDECFECPLEEMPGSWNENEDSFRLDIGPLLALVRTIKRSHMRPWNEDEDELDSMWGEDAWYWCSADHPDAIPYWELPWD